MLDKVLAENFIFSVGLRLITLIVPFASFPYLIKTLGSDRYGLIIWAWSIINIFVAITKFGFDVVIVKKISLSRSSKDELEKIVCATLFSKIMLANGCLLILIIICAVNQEVSNNIYIFLTGMLIVYAEALTPIWYFQGLERIKFSSILIGIIKMLFACLVLMFINDESDYDKVLIIYGVSQFMAAMAGLFLLFNIDGLKIRKFGINYCFDLMRESASIFLSSSLSTLKDSLTILLLNNYLDHSSIGIYDLINKVLSLAITPFHIFAQVVFPSVAVHKNKKKIVLWARLSTVFSIALLVLILLLRNIIFKFMNIDADISFLFSFLMFSSIVFLNLSSLFGTLGLAAFGRNKIFFYTSLKSFFLYVCVLYIVFEFLWAGLVACALVIFVTSVYESYIRYKAFHFYG